MFQGIDTYDKLQSLIDREPDVFFENQAYFSSKFPLYVNSINFPESVILKYVGNGLNPSTLLISQKLSGYTEYYVRTKEYGVDRVDEMYSNLDLLRRNNETLHRYSLLPYDDNFEYELEQLLEQDFIW